MNQTTISILWLVALVAVFYFFIFRPQVNRQKEQTSLVNSIAVDDQIITAGGIYGTVRAVEGDVLDLEIAPDVVVRVAKAAVARKLEA